jgi:hypothetical protein
MSEIRHVARLQRPLAPMIAHRPSTSSSPIEPPREARAWPDTVLMDWLRLRTMVDALLRRTAASKDAATAIAATRDRTGAATSTTPQTQEAIHG